MPAAEAFAVERDAGAAATVTEAEAEEVPATVLGHVPIFVAFADDPDTVAASLSPNAALNASAAACPVAALAAFSALAHAVVVSVPALHLLPS